MAFKTMDDLRNDILNEVALVDGSSVQTYTEPLLYSYLQTAFDHVFSKRYWPWLTSTTYHTLDGAGGVVTDTIDGLEYVSDIKWVREYPYTESDEIPFYEDGIFDSNKLAYTGFAWTETQYATKRIKFNPVTSVAQIAVRARRKPSNFVPSDTVPFDHTALKHFVVASLLGIDGMNPDEQTRQMGLFEDRYQQLVSNEGDKPITSKRNRFASEFTVEE